MLRRLLQCGLCLVFAGGLLSCHGTGTPSRVLRVGFVPSENVQEVTQNAQPIVTLLQQKLGMEVQPFVATDYTGVVEALRANKLDTAFLTPASYVLAKDEANVRVILKSERRGSPFYYAAVIVHADSGISKLEDLRDKTFAFTDPLSTSGNIFPRKMLRDLYQIDGFVPATDKDYDLVREAFRLAGINLKESLKKKTP